MGLVYTRTDSGLVLAEHGQDEAAVARALRAHDPDLRLVRQLSEKWQQLIWKVYLYRGPDREAEFVCAWTDRQGVPLPLSYRLVDHVKELDRNSRAPRVDADELNRAARERQARQEEQDQEALVADWEAREGRSAMLHRGVHLRMARDKARARGEKV